MSGLIGQFVSWKWVFWVISILAAIVTVGGILVIPPLPSASLEKGGKPTVDWIGGAIITVALFILMFALTEGNVVGWSTPWIPVLIVLSILMVVLFVGWQWFLETRTNRNPLMNVSIWKSGRVCGAMITMSLFFASFSNYLVFTTFYFQSYQGLSIIQTMLRYIPTGVSGIITVMVTGYLLSRARGNHILMFGTLCVGISNLLYAVPIPPQTTFWAFGFPAMVLSVFGADTVYPTLTLFTAQSLPSSDQALGGALINSLGQIGRAIGLAIATAVQTAVMAAEEGVDVKKVGGKGVSVPEFAVLISWNSFRDFSSVYNYEFSLPSFSISSTKLLALSISVEP